MRRRPGIGGLQTAAAARTRGDRPDHEAVDAAKARLAEIDSMFSNDLDEIKLEEKQKKAIERERQMHKTLISLDQMHQSYDKMLCKAEKRLEKLYESVNAGKQPLQDINRAYVLPIKMMKKSLDKHHDDSANEISSSSKIDQKLCFKITSLENCNPSCCFSVVVGSTAAQKRKQNAVSVGKERIEALFRTKRLCRAGVSTDTDILIDDNDMMIEEEQSILESQTTSAVQELNLAITFHVLVKTDVLQLLVERLMLIPQLEALVGRHSRPLTFWIGSQQKKQCFQQAEEHCSKAISLAKKVSCLYYFCKKLVMLLTWKVCYFCYLILLCYMVFRYKFCETIQCLEDGVEKMKIQCLEGGYVGNYH
ncbi:hypothetical protein LXL04_029793 [Taraxacum kok-saghyz]